MAGQAQSTRSARARARSVVTCVAVVSTLLLATVAGCIGRSEPSRPSVQEKLKQSGIWGQAVLRIGVAGNEPLMGELKSGAYRGFDVEIGRYLARSLGYDSDDDIKFVQVRTDDRLEFLIGGKVDLVVASLSYTEERAKLIGFAGPYFVTRQAFLVPTASVARLQTLDDFLTTKARVCSAGSSTTESELGRRGVTVKLVKDLRDCITGMRAGRYDAMSSDKTILTGFLSESPKDFQLLELPLGAIEQLCVGVPLGDAALRDLVGYFLKKSYLAGKRDAASPWLTAYNTTLRPYYGENEQPEPRDAPDLVDFDDKIPPR